MGVQGSLRDRHPVRPHAMMTACRKAAADMRREAAAGMGPVRFRANVLPNGQKSLSRAAAAESMDRRADAWERAIATGDYTDVGYPELNGQT